jgi:hypothetical protein
MSHPHDPLPPDVYLREIRERIAQQEALVRHTIVKGTPTQAAEDRLRELQQTLRSMTEQRQRMRTGEVQRKMRARRT